MQIGPVLEYHLNMGQPDHLNTVGIRKLDVQIPETFEIPTKNVWFLNVLD